MKKLLNKHFIPFAVGVVLAVIFICAQLVSAYAAGYSTDSLETKNLISTYKADMEYGELNEIYAAGEGLTVDGALYDRLILYGDLADIAAAEGVEYLLAYDMCAQFELENAMAGGTLIDSLCLRSIPSDIFGSYSHLIDLRYFSTLIETGRMPADGADELAASYIQLSLFFGFTDGMLEDPIGQTATLDGREYTVVGVTSCDVCYISYEPGDNLGFYLYDPLTADGFIARNVSAKEALDYIHPTHADELFIYTADGAERQVLNALMLRYPAENFYSHEYVVTWVEQYNAVFASNALISALILAVLLGLVLALLAALWAYRTSREEIRPRRLFMSLLLLVFGILGAAALVAVSIVPTYGAPALAPVAVSLAAMAAPTVLMQFFFVKR